MFISGRFILGTGLGLSQVNPSMVVAMVALVKYGAFDLSLYYAFWELGTLFATGVCYGVRFPPRFVRGEMLIRMCRLKI
jgi:fucose permease